MLPLVLIVCVVAIKVFKKSAPNGKITVYLGKRDYVDNLKTIEPIDGVVVLDNDYLKNRKVFGEITTLMRYGREDDEVMGLKFSKSLTLVKDQIYPAKENLSELSDLQKKLIKKLGPNAHPFTLTLPSNAPNSVTIQVGADSESKPLGIEYQMKAFVANSPEEKVHKRSSVNLAIRKVQYFPEDHGKKQPSTLVSKGFALSSGKINLDVTLSKEIFYHGEGIVANVQINNNSKKDVKNIKVAIIQHCEITMVNMMYTRQIAQMESREGCPVVPGASLRREFFLKPEFSCNKDKHGVALDGRLKDEDAKLASSTLVAVGKTANDSTGIIVSYSFRVRLNCGALGGEVVADLPFKLMHPIPGSIAEQNIAAEKKRRAIEGPSASARQQSLDGEIVFEDFKRQRTIDLED